MALNKEVFKTRALTALLFVAVMLIGLLIHPYLFFLLFSIIHTGAWWEYFNVLDKINNTNTHMLWRIGFMLLGMSVLLLASTYILHLQQLHLPQNFGITFIVSGFLLSIIGVFKSKLYKANDIVMPLFGFLYISISIGSLLYLTNTQFYTNATTWLPYGLLLPAFIIACMWINDTMAYLVGSFIGKTPLSSISPKKTWEGTIGGIVLCGIVVGFAMYGIASSYLPISLFIWIILATIAAILGTIGDLVESKLKRMANVKDSGKFMPGHGGFLDRFDSLLFATPFMALLLHFIINKA